MVKGGLGLGLGVGEEEEEGDVESADEGERDEESWD